MRYWPNLSKKFQGIYDKWRENLDAKNRRCWISYLLQTYFQIKIHLEFSKV